MPKQKELWEQIVGKCRHFNGIMNKTCKVGLAYPMPLPCLGDGRANAPCDQYSPYTEAEARQQQKESEESFRNIIIARAAIMDHVAKHKVPDYVSGKELTDAQWRQCWGWAGYLGCPVCKTGQLHFSIAGSNGHVHASCTTENCISWIE